MSYRWLRPDGSVHAADGVRTPFPRTVAPGETVVVPLHVVAPPEPGDYVLHVDVVHDEVTWFDCPWTQPVRVGAPDALPPVGERLTETHVPRRRLRLRLRPGPGIPHTLHRVWLGSNPLPEPMRRFGEGFAALHPGWTVRLWGDADLAALGIGDAERALARGPSELSNLVRYEVLHRLGGVYADTDVEFKRPFDELAESTHAFAALELPGRLGSAVLGAAPGHRVFARAAALARSTLGLGTHSPDANGPYLLSLVVEQEGGVTILVPGTFYPYLWDEPERAGEEFPDALAVHRWALSWRRTPVV
jgi:hypothetical protein